MQTIILRILTLVPSALTTAFDGGHLIGIEFCKLFFRLRIRAELNDSKGGSPVVVMTKVRW